MPGLVVITWYGLFAPAGVKPDIVERLNAEVVKVMNAPGTPWPVQSPTITA